MTDFLWKGGLPVTTLFLNTLFCLSLASTTTENPGPCFPSSPCGLNTECEVGENGTAVCNCLPGFQHMPGSEPFQCEGDGLQLVDEPDDWIEYTPTPCFLPSGTAGACVNVSTCPSVRELLTGFKENALTHDLKLLLKQSLFCPNKDRQICCPKTDLEPAKEHSNRDFCQLQTGDHAMCVQLTTCPPFMELMAGLKKPSNDSLVPRFIRSAFLCGAANGIDGRKHARICCPVQALRSLPEPTGYAQHSGRSQLASSENCGTNPAVRVVGGENAQPGQFPWLANLGYRNSGGLSYKCGGTIIGKRWVLTAAHCVTGLPSSMRLGGVRVGEHDLRKDPDCERCSSVQNLGIEQVIFHPDYNKPHNFMNDIALLKLDREVEYNDNTQPICLPWWDDHEDYTLNTFAGRPTVVEVAGWGATGPRGTDPAQILQFLEVPIFEQKRCTETYKARGATLEDKQLCAGGVPGKDSCSGDSGSGLMRKVQVPVTLGKATIFEPRSQLIGAVSFGPSFCGTNNVPGVYARVNSYLSWILDKVAEHA